MSRYKASEEAWQTFRRFCDSAPGLTEEKALEAMTRPGRIQEAVRAVLGEVDVSFLMVAFKFGVSKMTVSNWLRKGASEEGAVGFVWWLADVAGRYASVEVGRHIEDIVFGGVPIGGDSTFMYGRAFTAMLKGRIIEDEELLEELEAFGVVRRMSPERRRALVELCGDEYELHSRMRPASDARTERLVLSHGYEGHEYRQSLLKTLKAELSAMESAIEATAVEPPSIPF